MTIGGAIARENEPSSTKVIMPSSENVDSSTYTDIRPRERIAGSPFVPDGVKWADDGRVAVVSETSIVISTFKSRELDMYIQNSPTISKSFIFIPDKPSQSEHVPLLIPVFTESTDNLPPGSLTYLLLNDRNGHQHNPKEISLSKSESNTYIAATWGPRGSGPNASCALLALTSSSRVSLHFSTSFQLSWVEADVLSERLYTFLDSKEWKVKNRDVAPRTPTCTEFVDVTGAQVVDIVEGRNRDSDEAPYITKKRQRASTTGTQEDNETLRSQHMSITEFARRCELVGTLSMAWSPFVRNTVQQHPQSFIALSGRAMTTVWAYDFPQFNASNMVSSSLISSTPRAWINTKRYGWVTSSTWQQNHRPGRGQAAITSTLLLALGTVEGNVLLAKLTVHPSSALEATEVVLDRVVVTPYSQPVVGLRLGSRATYSNSKRNDLIVASGTRLSVWNVNQKRGSPISWKAHHGLITALDVDYFGERVFSCGTDGKIRLWETISGTEIPYITGRMGTDSSATAVLTAAAAASLCSGGSERPELTETFPLYGITVSPNTSQMACLYVIPPAARPNRRTQADLSYTRVSCAIEYHPSPYLVESVSTFVHIMSRILEESEDLTTFTDVLWLCFEDNASASCQQEFTDMNIPTLLKKLKGCSSVDKSSRVPLYVALCEDLEKRPVKDDSPPLFCQAAYLLRSCICPVDNDKRTSAEEALERVKRKLYIYWAEKCLQALIAMHNSADKPPITQISRTERISALLMADFLSVQQPLPDKTERLVTTIYTGLGSPENITRWKSFLTARTAGSNVSEEVPTAPIPPPRQTCHICNAAVPFGELDQVCSLGHIQERCFLSFQVISSMDTWRCMGCGACANELENNAFFLERIEESANSTDAPIVCRLCGNYCSFLRY